MTTNPRRQRKGNYCTSRSRDLPSKINEKTGDANHRHCPFAPALNFTGYTALPHYSDSIEL